MLVLVHVPGKARGRKAEFACKTLHDGTGLEASINLDVEQFQQWWSSQWQEAGEFPRGFGALCGQCARKAVFGFNFSQRARLAGCIVHCTLQQPSPGRRGCCASNSGPARPSTAVTYCVRIQQHHRVGSTTE